MSPATTAKVAPPSAGGARGAARGSAPAASHPRCAPVLALCAKHMVTSCWLVLPTVSAEMSALLPFLLSGARDFNGSYVCCNQFVLGTRCTLRAQSLHVVPVKSCRQGKFRGRRGDTLLLTLECAGGVASREAARGTAH